MPLGTDCLFFVEILGPGKSLRKVKPHIAPASEYGCYPRHVGIAMGIASHGPYLDMVWNNPWSKLKDLKLL
jgi:hypothetical protein